MMEERYHATTQNRFYPDMSNVNKNITGGKKYQPTYVHFPLAQVFFGGIVLDYSCLAFR